MIIPVVSASGVKSTITATDPTVTFDVGVTTVLPSTDQATDLTLQEHTLSVAAPVLSVSIYIKITGGQIVGCVYAANGPNGGPGTLLAQTGPFTPVSGWNTRPVQSSVSIPAGKVWIGYLPENAVVGIAKGGNSYKNAYIARAWSTGLPAAFPTSGYSSTTTGFSVYATFTGTSPPPPPSGALRVPTSVRMRGMNLAFNFSGNPAGMGAEGGNWVNFNWDGWWRPQLDDAALLGNCVCIWGSPQPTLLGSGAISQSTYLARWVQVLDYCVSKGLYVYARGGELGRWAGTDSQNVALFRAWADMAADYPNVIGIDLTNEAWVKCVDSEFDVNVTLSRLGMFKDAVNAFGIPAANSSRGIDKGNGSWTLDVYQGIPQAPFHAMGDFIDWHVYDSYAYAEMSAVKTHSTLGPATANKDVFFGEFGRHNAADLSGIAGVYNAMRTLIGADPRHVGGTQWACWDFSASTEWRYGLYTLSSFPPGTRTLRTQISNPFVTLPTTR